MERLTSRNDAFAQLVHHGDMSLTDCYRAIYNVSPETTPESVYVAASRMAKTPKVRLRIHELELEAVNARASTQDEIRQSLRLEHVKASDDGQHGPAIRAIELLAKMDGHIVDRRELSVSGQMMAVELTTEELRQLVDYGHKIASRYELDTGVIEGSLAPDARQQ